MKLSTQIYFPTFPKFFKWIWNSLIKPIGWFILITFAVGAGNILSLYLSASDDGSSGDETAISEDGSATTAEGTEACNIATIRMDGDVLPYYGANYDGSGNEPVYAIDPESSLAMIKEAEGNPEIKGIISIINSYGGEGSAASTIANALKRSNLPTVSYIRSAGTSGAYLIATGANTIIASPWADVGGIGVTMSYVQNVEQNKKDGLDYVPLSVGKFKDAGDPNKPLTYEERSLFERDLKIFHKEFIKEVAENRKLSIDEVAKVADGASMPASLALENRLIDQIGDEETAKSWFALELKMPKEEVVFCE